MADHRYDEKEVGAILKRASEIQAGVTPAGLTDGLTLGDLQKVAGEVGIDPAIVERAAAEIRTSAPEDKMKNGANTVLFDRTVEGIVSEEAWDEMVTRLRQYSGKPGRINIHGNTHEWWGGWDTGGVMLTTTSKNGKTRIKLMGETSGGAVLFWTLGSSFGFVGAIATGAILSKTSPNALFVVAVVAMILAAVFVATYLGLQFWRRKMILGMERVFVDLAEMVDDNTSALPDLTTTIDSPEEHETLFNS